MIVIKRQDRQLNATQFVIKRGSGARVLVLGDNSRTDPGTNQLTEVDAAKPKCHYQCRLMRVMLSEIDFERFVSKITEANNKKGEGEGGKRGGTIDEFDLSLRIFLMRGGVSYSFIFFFLLLLVSGELYIFVTIDDER